MRAGDADRFAAWYGAVYEEAWRFAYRFVHDRDAARDVVQDVFLAIWERRASWDVHGALQSYVLGAVRHRALNAVRHERIVERAAGAAADCEVRVVPGMGTLSAPTDAPVAEATLRDAMHRHMQALPERQRTALALRWENGLTNVEIAKVLGVGEAAVSRLLARATETLREVWNRLT